MDQYQRDNAVHTVCYQFIDLIFIDMHKAQKEYSTNAVVILYHVNAKRNA